MDSYPLSCGVPPSFNGDGLTLAFGVCVRRRRRWQRYHTPAPIAAIPATVAPATTPAITPALRAAPLLYRGAKLGRKVPTDSGRPPKSQAVMLSQGSETCGALCLDGSYDDEEGEDTRKHSEMPKQVPEWSSLLFQGTCVFLSIVSYPSE